MLKWLLDNGVNPKIIMNGGKIMSMDIPKLNIKFRDSLNYNPQSLAKWPATFGLDGISKGQFPHHFNRPENWGKILETFQIQRSTVCLACRGKDRRDFLQWYSEERAQKTTNLIFGKNLWLTVAWT